MGSPEIGYISVIEQNTLATFEVKRISWTYYTPESIVRGRQAHHQTEQVLIAAAMLTRHAEAAVAGTYADVVLVPDEVGLTVDSFLAIGDTAPDPAIPDSGYSRILLAAVGPENRGWHVKLVAETVRRATANQLSYVLMTTQATNRAVFRTTEKLGFRLGTTTHVFACHS